jgi:hypothetical protein
VKIVKNYPPNYAQIAARFNVKGRQTIVFTYGTTIYNPLGRPLAFDVIAHEEVHIHQQSKDGPEAWWKEYLDDPHFRLEQEIQAYRVQIEWAKRGYNTKDAAAIAEHCARTLAGPIYGGLLTLQDARSVLA